MKILAVSWWMPPLPSPRSFQVSRTVKSWRQAGHDVSVFCLDPDSVRYRKDARLLEAYQASIKFERIRAGENRFYGSLLWKAAPLLRLWQEQRGWVSLVSQAVIQAAADSRPDLIITFGQPWIDHLAGYKIREKSDIPWVAHFSDPWTDSPFARYGLVSRRINRTQERKVVESADVIAFTNTYTRDLMMYKYSPDLKAKTFAIPHSFDPDLYGGNGPSTDSPLVIRHIGSLYGNRTPEPLFLALQKLIRTDTDALQGVAFEFVGPVQEKFLDSEALRSLPEGLVRFQNSVGYLESLEMMAGSHGLLVIDAAAETNIFLPSKLIDYVGAARPVFGITPAGPSADLIKALGGEVSDPSEPSAVAESLKRYLAELRERDSAKPWGVESVREGFRAGQVAEAFLAEIRSRLI